MIDVRHLSVRDSAQRVNVGAGEVTLEHGERHPAVRGSSGVIRVGYETFLMHQDGFQRVFEILLHGPLERSGSVVL